MVGVLLDSLYLPHVLYTVGISYGHYTYLITIHRYRDTILGATYALQAFFH